MFKINLLENYKITIFTIEVEFRDFLGKCLRFRIKTAFPTATEYSFNVSFSSPHQHFFHLNVVSFVAIFEEQVFHNKTVFLRSKS